MNLHKYFNDIVSSLLQYPKSVGAFADLFSVCDKFCIPSVWLSRKLRKNKESSVKDKILHL